MECPEKVDQAENARSPATKEGANLIHTPEGLPRCHLVPRSSRISECIGKNIISQKHTNLRWLVTSLSGCVDGLDDNLPTLHKMQRQHARRNMDRRSSNHCRTNNLGEATAQQQQRQRRQRRPDLHDVDVDTAHLFNEDEPLRRRLHAEG